MAYQMAPLPATFSDLEGCFRCLKSFYLTSRNTSCITYDMFTQYT